MKTIDELLSDLRRLDVKLWLDGDNLCYKPLKESLSPSLLAQLRERKAEILTFLRQANSTPQFVAPPIRLVSRQANLPLSFAQQRLWFLTQLAPDSPVYNVPAAYRLRGVLIVDILERSLREMVRRHESLRTTFPAVDGQPSQAITPNVSLSLPLVDLQDLPPEQQEAVVQNQVSLEAQQPFNLAQGPLLRAKLLRLRVEEHVLLLSMHHIVSDGWSFDIFSRELTTLYAAFSNGQASPLPDLPLQYVDYAIWQRQWLQDDVLASQLNYWKRQLGDALPVLELPTDHPRPAVQTYRGAGQALQLPGDLTTRLKLLSKQAEVTLFMILLAAFKVLLHRYCGQDDIIVGSPIAGRNRLETEELIGFFINNLALRTDLGGNPSFRELLTRVRERVLGAYQHQDVPFEKLVEELQPERDPSRSPLFQVSFTFQNLLNQDLELPGLSIKPIRFQFNISKFDLSLYMAESADGLQAWLEYNTDLFEATTMTRMLVHFQTLLEGIIANPDQHLSDLPLLTPAERHQLLVKWNDTQVDSSHNPCIHQLFEVQVEQTPDAVALVFADAHNPKSPGADSQLTYRQLNTQANQLAHHLQTLGVGPGDLVGLCLERSVEMVVSLLGILKAGAAYVPLDPAYPQERLAYMLSDAQVSVLLTQQQLLSQLPQIQAQVVCLDASRAEIAQAAEANPASTVNLDNLAYVIYTSGSTGKPKGVLITHQGLCNLAKAQVQLFDVQPTSRVLQFASFSFDAAIWEVVMALCAGASLCLATQEALLPGANLMQLLRQQAITHVTLPPSALAALPPEPLPALKTIIAAGEVCSPDLAMQWSRQRRFFNAYGPSEATVCATVAECRAIAGRRLPIGRPIANTQVYILDRHLQPVPIGVPGELHISGGGLAQGYLNRPQLTAEKFISNPFGAGEQGSRGAGEDGRENPKSKIQNPKSNRLYKTGDLARYLPNGEIEFLGRIDHQVKIRGFRIELGDIETVLAQHPDIQEAVVIAREDMPGDQRLVAYFAPNQEQTLDLEALRLFLKDQLPSYMEPQRFVSLPHLPLTPNGKVDRRALPEPGEIGPELKAADLRPQTQVEMKISTIWRQMLQVNNIGIHDNFFDLGGHSLLMARLHGQLSKTFNADISVVNVFSHPTIYALAQLITKGIDEPSKEPLSNKLAQRRQARKSAVQHNRQRRHRH